MMDTGSLSRVIVASVVALMGWLTPAAAEITLMTTDYPPYYASSLPDGGPLSEIVVEAFEKVDHHVRIEFVPWVRALEYAKAGKVDGLHGAWYSPERERWFVFSHELVENELVLLKRKGEKPERFTSLSDLAPYTIGVVRGYQNPSAFEAANLRTDEADSDTTNLRKLIKRRVDMVLIDRAVASYLLSTELTKQAAELEALEPPVEVLPMYLLISKKVAQHQQLVDDFNRGLALLEAEGRVDEILEKLGRLKESPIKTPRGGDQR